LAESNGMLGRYQTEWAGGLKRNAWANKNGISGRIGTEYAGDYLIADNYALVHGREAFVKNSRRHIRRVQIL